jgi:hypothetical protein
MGYKRFGAMLREPRYEVTATHVTALTPGGRDAIL